MDSNYEKGKKLLRGGYTQYTPDGRANFVKAGAYGKLPKKGAYQYNYIASKGRVGHVAVVEKCEIDYDKRVFTTWTIEGNTSSQTWDSNGGMVSRKVYRDIPFDAVGVGTNAHIDGFGYPDFGEDTCTPDELIEAFGKETGYIEKRNDQYNGDPQRNATEWEKTVNKGINNFTKYGIWMHCNGVQWCAQSASWAAWLACKIHSEKKQTGWKTDGYEWYYQVNGVFAKDQWLYIDSRWYAFDGAGHMVRGWFLSEDEWYYLNPEDGAMLNDQWLDYRGAWYYLTHSGAMAKNVFVKDNNGKYCYIDSDGKWDRQYRDGVEPGTEVIKHE